MDQMRPELDNVLECLSLNGYSIVSLVNDILGRSHLEDPRVKLLREGIERDAAEICARLLRDVNISPERVLEFGRAQCACSSSSVGLSTRTELGG
jgi:hypothetical protein